MFAQAALDFTRQPENVETLVAGGAVSLLQHLSQDVSPGIQHLATFALGRLATHSQEVAESVVTGDFQHFLVSWFLRNGTCCIPALATISTGTNDERGVQDLKPR